MTLSNTYRNVEIGEIFNGVIDWSGVVKKTKISWEDNVNPDDESGYSLDDGGWGFAGYDAKHDVYTRYKSSLESNEHCFRIVS